MSLVFLTNKEVMTEWKNKKLRLIYIKRNKVPDLMEMKR